MTSETPQRFWLITYPRTASNLLNRILALDEQPNVLSCHDGGYFFRIPYRLMTDLKLGWLPQTEWPQEARDQLRKSYQKRFNDLVEHLNQGTAQGKITFFKEHLYFILDPTVRSRFLFGVDSVAEQGWKMAWPSSHSIHGSHSTTDLGLNDTLLPDDILETLSPVFLIRHPALAFPCLLRAYRDLHGVEASRSKHGDLEFNTVMTLRWTRRLYERYVLTREGCRYYVDNASMDRPIILDADDVITNPEVLVRFCKLVGLDASRLRFTWESIKPEVVFATDELRIKQRMWSTLLTSEGILSGKTSHGLDMDRETRRWKDEFGESDASKLEHRVRAAMEDYDYLKARRLQTI
ncbi:uncharacterized protein P174DRAFT_424173 [Aspergillus novofumigatus IBT 16806]|uniref:Sulfotransferase family protein n=1 Tax=Aspergillus novofumigatus (strain IBT 16806) TaxID=1392255 RepID=A0A2I1BX73_ASPN1|nr:uncharacterized protein P174DRAFT_424173 [Aspergillus novofumigatus IBT 16806]PKX89968.1 hypothetical protein P174DRAFT_424173 [Aspergillus novofumigatus IBT 16806]